MANRQKYPTIQLRGSSYEIAEHWREPGEQVRQIGEIEIDRSCFKKTAKEKEILKLAKMQCKDDEMKRSKLFALRK